MANRAVRLRTLGLDTATLKSVTLVSPAYIQVLEVCTVVFSLVAEAVQIILVVV